MFGSRFGRSRLAGAGFAVVLLALAPWQIARADTFPVETATLPNGLQVVVIPDHRAPIVTQIIYYKIGSSDSPVGLSGLAHMLEHMMFQGTSTTPGSVFHSAVAIHGGDENAFTQNDVTAYHQTVGKEALELVIQLESDRMHNLTISETAFRSELQVVEEERRMRTENTPGGLFSEQFGAAQYLAHPYGLPTIGWMGDIERYTREDAVAWYTTWYVPNNAVLVFAGDTTLAEVLPLVQRYYGPVPSRATPPRIRAQEPPQLAERRVIFRDSRVRQPSITRSYIAPTRNARDGMAAPLSMLAQILSGGTGRLNQSLVIGQKIAAGAGAGYGAGSMDPSTFTFSASVGRNGDIAALETALDAEIAKLLKDGVTQEELDRVKNGIDASYTYGRDQVQSLARLVGGGLAIGLTMAEVQSWPEDLKRATVDDVNKAARAVLVRPHAVTGLLLPDTADFATVR